MRGEALTAARFERGGIPFDRRYAWRDDSAGSNRLGELTTARQHRPLLGYAASVADGAVIIKTPDGVNLRATDEAFAARLRLETGLNLSIAEDAGGGLHDDADVLVINEASVTKLAEEWGHPIDLRRFRPNVVVNAAEPFQEDAWVGRYMKIGEATLEVAARCIRCVVTTVDPETLAVDPSFLKTIAERHEACFGVYCRVATPGEIAVGDVCYISADQK